MKKIKFSPNVLVLGSHRSGTSLVSDILSMNDIYMGSDLEHNNESKFFIGLNDYIMNLCGGSWDFPRDIKPLLNNNDQLEMLDQYIKLRRESSLYKRYIKKYENNKFYGWKDPRNTFTFKYWKRLYPEIRAIHVLRNGYDVAQSILKRNIQLQKINKKKFENNKLAYKFLKKRGRFSISVINSFDDAFKLWENYALEGLSLADEYNNDVITIKYESLIADHENTMLKLSDFIGKKIIINKNELRKDSCRNKPLESYPDDVRKVLLASNAYREYYK